MKQEKKRTTLYLTEPADRWLTKKSQKDGVAKNSILQTLINEKMEKEASKPHQKAEVK